MEFDSRVDKCLKKFRLSLREESIGREVIVIKGAAVSSSIAHGSVDVKIAD